MEVISIRVASSKYSVHSPIQESGRRDGRQKRRKERRMGGSLGWVQKEALRNGGDVCLDGAEVGVSWEPMNWAGPHGGIYI
jgi:hypothetical protein